MKFSKSYISLLFGLIALFALVYKLNQEFGQPTCIFTNYKLSEWKTDPDARYCIMKQIVSNQELKNMPEEKIIKFLGWGEFDFTLDNGNRSLWYRTNKSQSLDTYFLVIELQDGRVVKCSTVLH